MLIPNLNLTSIDDTASTIRIAFVEPFAVASGTSLQAASSRTVIGGRAQILAGLFAPVRLAQHLLRMDRKVTAAVSEASECYIQN